MQHIEFFHTGHFNNNYHRARAGASLSLFIDYFWETDFDGLWKKYPDGFSDILFPNTGYTYLINLGTPFVMQVGEKKTNMRSDGFLPRHESLECHHKPGNKLFGIKFKTSPIILEKKVNFSEYKDAIFPLSYLADQDVLKKVKRAQHFSERVKIFTEYFSGLVKRYNGTLLPIRTVIEILSSRNADPHAGVEELAQHYNISTRTLERYFEIHTGRSTKKVLQVMRIRKATEHIINAPATFDHALYGYYDHSHFYKHLRQFLKKNSVNKFALHLKLLEKIRKEK